MRQTKMIEWMENVEKAISRIMADKVYTSAEFKRERDNFHVSIHKFKYVIYPIRISYCIPILFFVESLLIHNTLLNNDIFVCVMHENYKYS